jgi:hypothetical protein
MYGNVKHALYQPCDKTTMVLVHFHLKVRHHRTVFEPCTCKFFILFALRQRLRCELFLVKIVLFLYLLFELLCVVGVYHDRQEETKRRPVFF